MLFFFTAAIFVSAALLFVVQPLTGKVLLPMLGGSPAVWNTCMVFFQAMLLLGYGYSHALSKVAKLRNQFAVHMLVMAAVLLLLPMPVTIVGPGVGEDPTLWLLMTLAMTVGGPFFVVSTTGPLLQRWFSRTDDPRAKDPYFLYAASNAGSMLGLLAYPLVIEPNLTRQSQSNVWAVVYATLIGLVLICVERAWRRSRSVAMAEPSPRVVMEGGLRKSESAAGLTWSRRLTWVVLAAVPSSLMLGVTQHVSTDIAAIPLLWVLPLSLYLLTFILAFSPRVKVSSTLLGRAAPILVLTLALTFLTGARSPMLLIVALHAVTFLALAWMCHRRLAEDRPETTHLTEFYLWLAVGGVLGGSVNALAGPLLFDSVLEYPLMLGLAMLLRPQTVREATQRRESTPRARAIGLGGAALLATVLVVWVFVVDGWVSAGEVSDPKVMNLLRGAIPCVICALALLGAGALRFAVAATALLCVSLFTGAGGAELARIRTFFGVHQVVGTFDARTSPPTKTWVTLNHGTTLHGIQATTPMEFMGEPYPDAQTRARILFTPRHMLPVAERVRYRQYVPTTYYHPSGPLGDVMKMLTEQDRLGSAAFIGLGAGTAAAYARPGSTFVFYEIDPAVVDIARNTAYFTYISDALRDPSVRIGFVVGDGRLTIAQSGTGPYDVIVIDAFTSDAIPVHLLTKEAFAAYVGQLKPGGVMAIHISSRYFDLAPVVAKLAEASGLVALLRADDVITREQGAEAKKESLWVILAREADDFGGLERLPTWSRITPPEGFPLWTDDYQNLMGVFVGWGGDERSALKPPTPVGGP